MIRCIKYAKIYQLILRTITSNVWLQLEKKKPEDKDLIFI